MLKDIEEYNIGNTPMFVIKLKNNNWLYIKLEKFNFLGSIKARTAYYMVKNLCDIKHKCVVESTSGNLGIALNYFLKERDIKFLCLIDESISDDKLDKIKKSGIKYRMVKKQENLDFRSSRIKLAKDLERTGFYHWTNQYDNEYNMLANFKYTAPEIWENCNGNIDICICPVGSGGTISGIAKYMKEKNENIKIIGVEPVGSTIFGGVEGDYINAGTGLRGPSGLIKNNRCFIDGYYQIDDKESIHYCKEIMEQYQLELGISSGMTFAAVMKHVEKVSNKHIVMISPDGLENYKELIV
ncbi:cysteine synthase family protein [Vallitalea sp.]|jgi:cysteine synthase A|uniref:cysteine synthase family protein n=1 Tax=Vallitalea sp. TaxID=1882829 RepID=UPI0025FAF348|nr:cysteine synthase family protein [Vallitalea sp.]MCT4688871.1 cysteine synthase family protein [Vallitalea sp.]